MIIFTVAAIIVFAAARHFLKALSRGFVQFGVEPWRFTEIHVTALAIAVAAGLAVVGLVEIVRQLVEVVL